MIRRLSKGPRILRDRINDVIDAVNRFTGISGDGFIKTNKTRSGITLNLDITKLRPRIWNKKKIHDLSDYLIAEWLFNGDYTDTSGNDNDLTNNGCVIENNTLKSATGDYAIAASALIPLDSDFTVCGWFKTNVHESQILMSQYTAGGAGSGAFRLYAVNQYVTYRSILAYNGVTFLQSTETNLDDGLWHWLVVTRLGNLWDMYLDGVHTGSQGNSSQDVANVTTEISGYSTGSSSIQGNLDSVRIYSRALTATEIKNIYQEGHSDISSKIMSLNSGVFEVQSTGTGDGIYNCYEQSLDATEWADTAGDDKFADINTGEVEVFNLFENDSVADYKEALVAGDRLIVFRWEDDEGNKRLCGIPIGGGGGGGGSYVRRAKTQEAAPADTAISVKIVNADDTEVGAAFDVNCEIAGGGNLNDAIPRLESGDYISIYNQGGKWFCTTVFQVSENCDCYET